MGDDPDMKRFDGFMKGVDLGGWISQFSEFSKSHFDTFITEDDIKNIAELGFDHVRVPVDYNVLQDEDGAIREEGFGYLEKCREWCEAHGLNMIIDLHECFGYSFDPLKDMDRRAFFYDQELQKRFLDLWAIIAERFTAWPEQVAFEPLNEVVLFDVRDAWNDLASRYVEMMRAIVPDSYIVIGGVCYNNVNTVKYINVPVDDRIIYNFHCYDPHVFTHQGAYWVEGMPADFRIGYPETLETYLAAQKSSGCALDDEYDLPQDKETGEWFFEQIFAPAVKKAEQDGVPLYCGEYGVIDLADNQDKLRWLKDIHSAFRKYDIGHALWNYKEKDFGFCDERFAEIREQFKEIIS